MVVMQQQSCGSDDNEINSSTLAQSLKCSNVHDKEWEVPEINQVNF